MKRIIYIVLSTILILGLLMTGLYFYTTSKSPFAVAQITEKNLAIRVEYCQPLKKNREIFGKLVPYNKVWRTGANTSTTITFAQDTKIAGKDIKKGIYSLFTIPNPDQWTIIINGKVGDWGAFSYKQEKDILRIDVPANKSKQITEKFNISFSKDEKNVNMSLHWDNVEVKVPFEG